MQRFENDQIARRYEELEHLESEGVQAYPYSFPKTHDAASAVTAYLAEEETEEKVQVAVAGRIVALRKMGKASFCHILDGTGRIQLYLKKDDLENYDHLKLLDIGDIVGVTGYMFRTRTGEISVHAESLTLLTKALVPLPVPKEETDEEGNRTIHDQFADKELRYRQRYIDLAVNPEVREVFRKRSRMISHIRRFLDDRGYMEVETPTLHTMHGGATARPFSTHMNALDISLYLRISLELNLKRLMVGGFEGVYELGKNFRNEGLDKTHNPEFTMLELYVAWHDYTWMAEMIEEMVSTAAEAVNGSFQTTLANGTVIDLTPPFRRATMLELIEEHTGVNIAGKEVEELKEIAKGLGLTTDPTMGKGKVIDEIFGERVQPKLIQPIFVMDIPVEMVPLAKRHRQNPELVEAWELIIDGMEIGPCFSELNDPRDQRKRLEEQASLRAAGDDEAMVIDEDFLHALEVGMPPATGVGIGIDRLAILLTGQESIRDVIFFPMMKPQDG
ncbi:MAG: lysine--tRNA ligase [Ignavibacteriae bacterium]|nr:lysine--tRNA ligase [Ignavibacteriota bacterium]